MDNGLPRKGREEGTEEPVNLGSAYAERETERALLVVLQDQDRKIWIPKSQIHDDSEVIGYAHIGEMIVSGWFARKERL